MEVFLAIFSHQIIYHTEDLKIRRFKHRDIEMNTAHAHSSHLKLVYYTQYKSLKSPPTLDSDKNCLKRQYY